MKKNYKISFSNCALFDCPDTMCCADNTIHLNILQNLKNFVKNFYKHDNSCVGSLTLLVRSGRSLQFEPVILGSRVRGGNWFKHSLLPISPSQNVAFVRPGKNLLQFRFAIEFQRLTVVTLQPDLRTVKW